MPTITIQREELEEYLAVKLESQQLRDTITRIGTDIDEFTESTIVVEIFPNRPDLLSVPGLARAINNYTNKQQAISIEVEESSHNVEIEPSVKGVRPHTRCMIVKGLKLSKSKIEQIIQLQEKLHVTFGRRRKKAAIGVYPLQHITFPIRYHAKKPEEISFTPLGSESEITAQELLTNHPTGKKYAHLLEDQSHYPLFTDAKQRILSVPPIINSAKVGEVNPQTTSVFVEVSGHETHILEQAISMLAFAFADMGGTIQSVTITDGKERITSPDLEKTQKPTDVQYILQRSGIPSRDVLTKSLLKMGLQLEDNIVSIPAYRTDFLHDVDIIEDALIGFGYENLVARVPEAYTVGAYDAEYVLEEKIREVLVGFGIQEVMTYSLHSNGVKLANPLTQEYSHLREELLASLLDVLGKNLNNSYPQLIFEIDTTFKIGETSTGVQETRSVAAIICSQQATYTEIRQILEALTRQLQLNTEIETHTDPRFIEGRCARISGDITGVIGEVHPQELAQRGIMMPAAAFEIQRK